MTQTLFCFGIGFSALALAEAVLAQGWTVCGTFRDPENYQALKARGIDAVAFGTDLHSVLDRTTHLLSGVPPADGIDDPVLAEYGGIIAKMAARFAWVGYLSTTGVYGNRDGGPVDETSELLPTNKRSQARVRAEMAWQDLCGPVHIFRLAGIYGPGRNALDAITAGMARRIVKPGQVFGRIHIDDLVATLRASMDRPHPGTVYNVCDDRPAPPQDVIAHASRLLGIAPPPEEDFATADLTPMARSFYADNKRVSNDRIKTELGVRLAYPDYEAGLEALMSRRKAGEPSG